MSNKKPTIGIIGGRGKMGGWLENFFIKLNLKVLISDFGTPLTNKELTQQSDIVIISVPILKVAKVVKEIKNSLKKDALLCDVTSLKVRPVEEMKRAKVNALGMHPLFGPLTPNLEGQTIVFCHVKDNNWVKFLERIFVSQGAEIVEISPKEHDKQVAIIQALIHFTNISFARTLYAKKWRLNSSFFTPVFRLQTMILGRILGQKPEMLASIQMENPYFPKILTTFKKEVSELADDIKKKSLFTFDKKFKETSENLDNFRKIAETKSAEVLRIIDYQPIKTKKKRRLIDLKKTKVGFLGPVGTFSHQAAREVFSKKTNFVAFNTTKDIFESINNHKIDFGVVPIENSTTGIVFQTMNDLIKYPVKVTGSFDLAIHQSLLSRNRKKEEIERVVSHEQALSQCKNWLSKNMPSAKRQSALSTVYPIMKEKGKRVGFIASIDAAEIYRLNVLAKNIEDNKNNFTKFYIISNDIHKKVQKKLNIKKTLLLFAVYDRVGVLRDILDIFTKNNLNLSSLHSIPSHLKTWDYLFFVEIEHPYPSSRVKGVIKALEKHCPIIRVIGVS